MGMAYPHNYSDERRKTDTPILKLEEMVSDGIWITRNWNTDKLIFWTDQPRWSMMINRWQAGIVHGVVSLTVLKSMGIVIPSLLDGDGGGPQAMIRSKKVEPNPTCPSCGVKTCLTEIDRFYHPRGNKTCLLEGKTAARLLWERRPEST